MRFDKLKVGIVGLGEQTMDNLLPSIYLSQYTYVIAICDIDEVKLAAIGEKTGIANQYTDYKQMIDTEVLDVIVVSSFPEIHFQVAKYAIKRGKHVFVEKPPVSNIEQLKELVTLAQLHSVKTGVGMNFSYTDSHKILKEIIADDDFGSMCFVSVEHVSSKPISPLWNLDAVVDSFLLAQLIHPLDYLLSLGGSYRSMSVHCSKLHSPFFIQLMIEFDNGIIGCLKSGSFYPRFKHEVEIISTTGNTVIVKDLSIIEVTRKNNSTPFNLKAKNCSTVYTPSPLKSGYSKAGYTIEFNAFFENIKFDTNYFHAFEDMLHVYKALDEIKLQINCKGAEDYLSVSLPATKENTNSLAG